MFLPPWAFFKDADHSLTLDEFKAGAQKWLAAMRAFRPADQDGDRRLSKEEYEAAGFKASREFDEADSNHDGSVDRREYMRALLPVSKPGVTEPI